MFCPFVYVRDCARAIGPAAIAATAAAHTTRPIALPVIVGSPIPARPVADALVLLLLLRRGCRLRRRCDRAERAADHIVVPGEGDLLPPARHLGLELLVGQRYALAEVDEHVRHRPIARSL